MPRLAAIDIGSNTVILLIVELPPPPAPSHKGRGKKELCPLPPRKGNSSKYPLPRGEGGGGGWRILCDEARITRLSEGLKPGGSFLPAAMERTVAVLREFRQRCDSLKVDRIVAAGTAAFRKAKNPKLFIDRVKKECGIEIQVITGDEEARLSYASVVRDFGAIYKNVAALDIGGGSTELVLGPKSRVSLPLGTVALTEKYFRHDPPTQSEVASIQKFVGANLCVRPAMKEGRHLGLPLHLPHPDPPLTKGRESLITLIGLAGTCTTLAAVEQRLDPYDPEKVQGFALSKQQLTALINQFRKKTVADIKQMPGMDPGRADTILAGAIMLEEVMNFLGIARVIVSDRGLRYGMMSAGSPSHSAQA